MSRSRPSPSTAAVRRCSRRRWSGWRGRSAALAVAEPTASGAGSRTRSGRTRRIVSGTQRDERALLTAIPGAIGKAGAESCYAVALPDGRAFALKTDDGAPRVRPVLMAEALRRSGVSTSSPASTPRRCGATGVVELLGGGQPVGEIRACF